VAALGPLVVKADPLETVAALARHAPTAAHPFGTAAAGRDILSRVINAIRLDLGLALVISALATALGATVGLISGYVGGRLDQVLMRIIDILMAFPGFILAVSVAAVLGNNIRTVILAIAIAYTPVAVRVVRSQVLSLREAPFVEASRAIGTPAWGILFYHLLPNTLSVLLVQSTLFLAWAVMDTAGLRFIGLGIRPPTPELGSMTAEGAEYMVSGEWWMSVFPGGTIMVLVLAFNLLGDGLRDIFDPRRRD